jgi:hypothetical protein
MIVPGKSHLRIIAGKYSVCTRNGTTQINGPINQFIFSLGWMDNYSLVQRIHACTPTAHSAVDGRTDGLRMGHEEDLVRMAVDKQIKTNL